MNYRSLLSKVVASRSSFLLAMWERLAYRGASAAIILFIAAIGTPAQMGAYGTGVVTLLFFQSITDMALRQAGVVVIAGPRDETPAIRKVAWLGAITATFGTLATTAALLGISPRLYAILPLAVTPLSVAPSIVRLVQLQHAGRWAQIARAQSLAATGSLVVCIPLAFASPLLAAATQTLVAEGAFSLLILATRRRCMLLPGADRGSLTNHYLPTALSNGIAWGQSQGERATLSVLGRQTTLGHYTLANSLTRTIQDAAVLGIVNYLRPRLAQAKTVTRVRSELRRVMMLSGAIALSVQALVVSLSLAVLPPLLGTAWDTSLHLVPMLSTCLMAPALIAPTTAALLQLRQARGLLLSQTVGFAFSVVTGLVLASSLRWGVLAIYGRDLFLLLHRLFLLRTALSPRERLSAVLAVLAEGVTLACALAFA